MDSALVRLGFLIPTDYVFCISSSGSTRMIILWGSKQENKKVTGKRRHSISRKARTNPFIYLFSL